MREAVTKRPRRRSLAAAMLMMVAAAGTTAVGIAAANASESGKAGEMESSSTATPSGYFVAVFTPTSTDPSVAGNGIAPEYNDAESLARNGLSNLCKSAGYFDVAPGVQTNAAAASSGQSKTPDGQILFTAIGQCAR